MCHSLESRLTMTKAVNKKQGGGKSERTRLHILKNAARQFSKHGYYGVSMDAMASSMKLTKGALYGHFKGKQDIYIQSTVWYIEQAIHDKFKTGFSGNNSHEKLIDYMRWLLVLMDRDDIFRQLLLRILIDSEDKVAQAIAKKVFIKPFRTLAGLIKTSHPEKDAEEYARSLFSIASLSKSIKKIDAALSPSAKHGQGIELLLEHFQELVN